MVQKTSPVFIALGSNLGKREDHLKWAVQALAKHPDIEVTSVSPVYETEAHTHNENDVHPGYLNAVLSCATELSPIELLKYCLSLEMHKGRTRSGKKEWLPRTLDLDVLAFNQISKHTSSLILPHPRLHERKFVLVPWNAIAPGFVVPHPFGKTVAELLQECEDMAYLEKTSHQLLD